MALREIVSSTKGSCPGIKSRNIKEQDAAKTSVAAFLRSIPFSLCFQTSKYGFVKENCQCVQRVIYRRSRCSYLLLRRVASTASAGFGHSRNTRGSYRFFSMQGRSIRFFSGLRPFLFVSKMYNGNIFWTCA